MPRMKKQFQGVVNKLLDDVEFAEVQDHPEFVDMDFSVDIMEQGHFELFFSSYLEDFEAISCGVSVIFPCFPWFSTPRRCRGKGREIVEILRRPETSMKIADNIAIYQGIDTNVSVVAPAASRKLSEVEIVIQWTSKSSKPTDIQVQIGGRCLKHRV